MQYVERVKTKEFSCQPEHLQRLKDDFFLDQMVEIEHLGVNRWKIIIPNSSLVGNPDEIDDISGKSMQIARLNAGPRDIFEEEGLADYHSFLFTVVHYAFRRDSHPDPEILQYLRELDLPELNFALSGGFGRDAERFYEEFKKKYSKFLPPQALQSPPKLWHHFFIARSDH